MNEISPLNKDAALAICEGDEELFKELLGIFMEDSVAIAADVKGAVDSGNASALQKSAHAIKGASGNIAAAPLRDIAQLLERAGKDNDLKDTASLYQSFDREFQRLRGYLQEILK